MELNDATEALSGLAQNSRLAIFRCLVEAGDEGLRPTQIAAALGIPPNTLSFHLRGLMTARLVSQEKSGRMLIYRADFMRMRELLLFLTTNCCGGRPCAATNTADSTIATQDVCDS